MFKILVVTPDEILGAIPVLSTRAITVVTPGGTSVATPEGIPVEAPGKISPSRNSCRNFWRNCRWNSDQGIPVLFPGSISLGTSAGISEGPSEGIPIDAGGLLEEF